MAGSNASTAMTLLNQSSDDTFTHPLSSHRNEPRPSLISDHRQSKVDLDYGSWILSLPNPRLRGRSIKLREKKAIELVESIRGRPVANLAAGYPRIIRGRFGEDLVGEWIYRNCGPSIDLQHDVSVGIPSGGIKPRRRADWVVDDRIIVEVKTGGNVLGKGERSKNTHQLVDLASWRDSRPDRRAVLLARVSWAGNSLIDPHFGFALKYLGIPVLTFQW